MTWYNFTIFGWSRCFMIRTSRNSFCKLLGFSCVLSMILMATSFPVGICFASFTLKIKYDTLSICLTLLTVDNWIAHLHLRLFCQENTSALTLAKFPFPMVLMSLYLPICGCSSLVPWRQLLDDWTWLRAVTLPPSSILTDSCTVCSGARVSTRADITFGQFQNFIPNDDGDHGDADGSALSSFSCLKRLLNSFSVFYEDSQLILTYAIYTNS